MASAADIAKALNGAIGANDEEATVRKFLDTGFPPLNHALAGRYDGGLPWGRVVEVSGPPSSGKTAISTQAMACAQALGGLAGFCDHERSFAFTLAELLGLNTKPGHFIYRKPETFEESVAIFVLAVKTIRQKKLIAPDAPIAWVFDSLAAMIPHALLYDAKGNPIDPKSRNMKDKLALATASSAQLPIVAQIAEQYGVLVLILNQLRTKPGVLYGDPTYTPGGDAKDYYYSQRLRLSSKKIQKGKGAEAEVLGNEVTCRIIKNKINRPFLSATWRFMFQPDGSGRFDIERSLVDFLESQEVLPPGLTAEGKPRDGFVTWEGKSIGKETLARQIEKEGPAGLAKLRALLPAKYEPPVVAEVELEGEAA